MCVCRPRSPETCCRLLPVAEARLCFFSMGPSPHNSIHPPQPQRLLSLSSFSSVYWRRRWEKDNYWLREDAKCQRSHVCPLPPSPSAKPDIFHRHTTRRTFPSRRQPRRSFLIYEMDDGFIFNLLSLCKKHKTFSDFYTNDVCNAG